MGFDIKQFGVNLALGFAVDIVRGWFNEQLKDIQPSDLYEAIIQNNDLWSVTPEKLRNTGHKFKQTYGALFEKFEKEITTELLLGWMQKDHPVLFSTIINTNISGNRTGIMWFDNQVRQIKQKIIEM